MTWLGTDGITRGGPARKCCLSEQLVARETHGESIGKSRVRMEGVSGNSRPCGEFQGAALTDV